MLNNVNRLICLDANLSDVARLREGAIAGSEVVELTPDGDGFCQIAESLATLAGWQTPLIQELHIVSHGAPGCLYFGDICIDTAALSQYATVFAAWKSHLAEQATIYLYGCEVGAGLVGQTFVNELSQLLGLPVAASATLTGNAALGGDWQLAVQVGQVKPAIAFTTITQRKYAAVLINPYLGAENLGTTNLLYNNGDATQTGNSLRLTNDQTFQRSSSYLIVPVDLDASTSFNTSFQFRLGGAAGTNSTDGFTFTLQNSAAGVQALGSDGGNMGYGGVDRSLAIKFDTFENTGIDLGNNSVSIVRDGSVLAYLNSAVAPVDLNDGQLHTAWIDYDGLTDQLNVYVGDAAKPGQATLSTTIDLTSVVGNQAYVGFTGGTGFIGAQQEIFNWSLQAANPRAAAPPPAVPVANVNLVTVSNDLIGLNGAANRGAGGTLVLTPDQVHSRGSAFYATPIQVNANTSFNTQFQFVLDGQAGTNGADGFTFTLQNSTEGARTLGAVGSYVGIGGVLNSLSVKFDTYKNAGDVAENTVSIVRNGDVYAPVAIQAVPFDLNNGASYSAWVEYDGLTNQLTVFLADGTAKPPTAILSAAIDLLDTVGNQAFIGFTAAAGGIANRQTITGWQFQTDTQVGNGDGLRGEYFDNADFTNLRVVRVDPTVNYDWALGSPEPAIAPDSFSVRWSGQVQSLYNEEYTFFTTSDEGVRLTVNGVVLINQLVNQTPTELFGKLALEAGKKYDIVLEYFEDTAEAQAQLAWSSASQVKQVIPKSQLFTLPYSPGTIIMASEPTTVREDAGFVTVQFDRIGGSDGYATVNYNTANNTAVAPQDFALTNTNVTFAPGETTKTVNIAIVNDNVIEGTESFGVALGQTAGAGLGTRRTVAINILDDDGGTSVFNLSRTTYTVDEGAGTAIITVQRSGDTTIGATVNYATTALTATAGADYTTTAGTLTFLAGEGTKTFAIPITNDLIAEVNETITVTLSLPTSGILGPTTTATLSILDNDVTGQFVQETLVAGLVEPTALEFATGLTAAGDQLLFVAEKRGTVKVVTQKNDVFTPVGGLFIDISDDVNNTRDRGLIGLAVHPEFLTGKPYIYLSYSYDPPEAAGGNGDAGRDGNGNRPSRMIRVTADAATGYTKVLAGSQVVLLGTNSTWANTSRPDLNSTNNFTIPSSGIDPTGANGGWIQDFLASDSESHSIGDVSFGPDGKLYVSNGDGTSYSAVDPRAARVMDLKNLSGKLLRLDPLTGKGLADNPFYDGNPDSNQSKVLDLGLRNPFRFTFNPTTGDPVIGDVGWTTWEEVNVGRGQNFGWPFFEGSDGVSTRTRDYENLASATDFYNSGRPVTASAYAYQHDGPNAIVVGDFYNGPDVALRGGLFTSDASRGTVDILFFNAAGTDVVDTQRLFTNQFSIVQMDSGPDGNMYFVKLFDGAPGTPGSLRRWVYR
jgi:glucose/arabinose dehydrogenase